jgi:hypothetical protein
LIVRLIKGGLDVLHGLQMAPHLLVVRVLDEDAVLIDDRGDHADAVLGHLLMCIFCSPRVRSRFGAAVCWDGRRAAKMSEPQPFMSEIEWRLKGNRKRSVCS